MISEEDGYSENFNVNGMILAAGAGTRLRPLTDNTPKALTKIYGHSLLDIVCNKMANAKVTNIAANSHYCAGKISEWLLEKDDLDFDIKLFHEIPNALGTGGPLINAKEHLCKDNANYFILHNCDIISNINLQELISKHHKNVQKNPKNLVTMCLVDGSEPRIVVDKNSSNIVNMRDVLNIEINDNHERFSYAGISCFSTEIFNYLPNEVNDYCIIELLLELMHDEQISVGSYITNEDIYWNDIGSSSCFYDVHKYILDNEHHELELLGCNIDNKHDFWSDCKNLLFLEEESKQLYAKNKLKINNNQRAILIHDEQQEHHFVVDYFHSQIAKILQNLFDTSHIIKFTAELLKEQGSSRRFYRINFLEQFDHDLQRALANNSEVLMISSKDDFDFERFIEYGTIYRSHGINVPEIYGVDKENHAVLMEDFGDFSLYDFHILNAGDDQSVLACYKQIIDELIVFQNQGQLITNTLASLRIFDHEYLRWETNYFLEYFLHLYCKEDLAKLKNSLDEIFAQLAHICLNETNQCLIHRDFQSMNIHLNLQNNSQVGIIDFQGGRIGSQFYDLASLINDPYVNLNPCMRDELYLYYCEKTNLNSKECLKSYLAATLQRNMQALGAYAFLSLKKNKKDYRQYISPGLRLLIENCQRISYIDDKFKKLLEIVINI
ncbi:sugar phosphate nucleotidyltransferase [Lentisphaerota bacterium WC36G]|nr:phosphotransferase [Lentisphaerae bacterium WC36]